MTILDHCGKTLMRRRVVGLGTGLSTENVDGESTSYPAGRSYRLQLDGSIVITFSMVPERKGRSICIHPILAEDGKSIARNCTADPEIPKHYYSDCF